MLEHLVPDPLRVVARLELAPTRRTRRTAAAAIVGTRAWSPAVIAPAVEMVALAAPALPPIPGVRSPAIVVIVTAAVVAPPPVHTVTEVAVAATTAPARTLIRPHANLTPSAATSGLQQAFRTPRGGTKIDTTQTEIFAEIRDIPYTV